MIEFFKKNWKVILVGITGLFIGFLLNLYANSRSEERILNALIAELKPIKEKLNVGRITEAEKKRMIELEAQIALLTS